MKTASSLRFAVACRLVVDPGRRWLRAWAPVVSTVITLTTLLTVRTMVRCGEVMILVLLTRSMLTISRVSRRSGTWLLFLLCPLLGSTITIVLMKTIVRIMNT